MKKLALLIGALALLILAGTVKATTYTCDSCDSCQSAIDNAISGDTIMLNQSFNFSTSGDCIVLVKDNLTLDCDSYTITDEYDGNKIITLAVSNATIENCNFDGSGLSVTFITSAENNSIIKNNNFLNGNSAIALLNGNNTIFNNYISNCGNGISIGSLSVNNVIYNNTIENSRNSGILIKSSHGVASISNFVYNNFLNNTLNAQLQTSSGINFFNTSITNATNIIGGNQIGGNYWAAPDGTGFSETCDNLDNDSFCDEQYNLDANNIDFLPLTMNYSEENETELEINWESPVNNSIINTTNSIVWQVNLSEAPLDCELSINGSANVSMLILGSRCQYTTSSLANGTYCGVVNANDIDESNVSNTQCATIEFSSPPTPSGRISDAVPYPFNVAAGLALGAGWILFVLATLFSSETILDPKKFILAGIAILVVIVLIAAVF